MDLILLKTFLAVAERGSFSSAAADLCCVQSNVTARIRRLEQHLGQPVFERGRGGARLTDLGQRLRGHALDLIARFEAAERDLLDAAGASAPLRLGAMETTAAVRLPPLLKALKEVMPQTPVSLRTGPTADLLTQLWERKLDAAFVAGPVDPARFRSLPAFREHLVAVRARGNRATGPLLAFRTGCSYRASAETWLRSQGKSDTETVEMGTLEGILGCVAAGMGFAVAPALAVQNYQGAEALDLTPLPKAYGEVETLLAWRLDHQPTRAHQRVCEILQEDSARTR